MGRGADESGERINGAETWRRERREERGDRGREALLGQGKAEQGPADMVLPQGLSARLAAELLLRDGPNALRPPKGTPEYVKFARQLAGGLQCLMWVAAAICLIAFAIQASEGDLTTDDNVSGVGDSGPGEWGQWAGILEHGGHNTVLKCGSEI